MLPPSQEEDLKNCQRLAESVYEELRRTARRLMAAEPAGHTLQATAVVNEAYLKLQDQPDRVWQDRGHFFAVAATTIRQILVDHGRKRRSIKRGGELYRVELDEAACTPEPDLDEVLAVDQALTRLERTDSRQARIVELRYFAGLKVEEIASVMDISVRTVKRDWEVARIWLHAELTLPSFRSRL